MTTTPTDAREVARQLALRIRKGVSERDQQRAYPDKEMQLIKDSGLLGLFVPRFYGGLEADYGTAVDVLAILAEADSNVAQSTQPHHCGVEALNFAGSDSAKERLLRPVGEQGRMLSNAYVEISDKPISEFKVTLSEDGDDFRLNGVKFYATGSRWADALYVPAVMKGTKDAKLVYVGTGDPGVVMHDDWDAMGQRTTHSGTVEFNNVLIPADVCFPAEPWNVNESYLGAHAQLLLAAINLGQAWAAMNDAVTYLRSEARPWFQSNVERATDDPYIIHHVGGWKVAADGAELMVKVAANEMDKARKTLNIDDRSTAAVAVSEAKIASTEAALKISNELFQVCGTRSTRARWNFDRHWRNIRTLTLHDPVDYKYKIVGDYVLNGTAPPVSGWS